MTKIKIGTIVNSVGLAGEMRVYGLSDFLDERFKPDSRFFLDDGRELIVQKARFKDHLVTVKFVGIDSVDEANLYRDKDLYMKIQDLHNLAFDEYYFFELMNCDVYENNQLIGRVIEVIEQPAHPVLRIQADSKTFLLPFVKSYILGVDVKKKRVEIKLIEGFL